MHFGVISKMAARNLPKCKHFRPGDAFIKHDSLGTPEQTRRLIVFRMQNDERFTLHKGRAKHLWGILIRDLGLEGKATPKQFAKKWENLKMKYKLLKGDPPDGAGLWCWFHLMDRAMTGHLGEREGPVLGPAPLLEGEGRVLDHASLLEWAGPVLSPAPLVEGEESVISPTHLANGEGSFLSPSCLVKGEWLQWSESERGREGGVTGSQQERQRLEREELDQEREELDQERDELEQERAELDQEREELRRETVAVETQRAVLEKETAGVDREHRVLDREHRVLERERAVLEREWAVLEREMLSEGRGRGAWHKGRLLCLWERLT